MFIVIDGVSAKKSSFFRIVLTFLRVVDVAFIQPNSEYSLILLRAFEKVE